MINFEHYRHDLPFTGTTFISFNPPTQSPVVRNTQFLYSVSNSRLIWLGANVDTMRFVRFVRFVLLGKMSHAVKRLLQIRLDVIDMFNPNTDTDEILRDARRKLFLVTELLMGRNRRCNNQLSSVKLQHSGVQSLHLQRWQDD
jgi:hypothetical protein